MIRHAFVDLDDTLIGYEIDGEVKPVYAAYYKAIDQMVEICQSSGIEVSREMLVRFQSDLDVEACQKEGFGSPGRFSHSLGQTYRHFASLCGCYDEAVHAQVRSAGHAVWQYRAAPLPGVLEALDALASNVANLWIVTKGPTQEQHHKVRQALRNFPMGAVICVDFKDEQDWHHVLPTSLTNTVAIGNSLVADVLIPVSCGVSQGFYLSETGNSWAYESSLNHEKYAAVAERIQTVPDFAQAVKALLH
jgi:FMN phosphatase YigB (HAD superfamily)